MVGLPINFAVPGEGAMASYDYYDLAEGTGIVKFYGYAIDTGSGTRAYKLTTNSGLISASGSNGEAYGLTIWRSLSGSGTKEVNFDSAFNMPQNIKGNVICNIQTNEMQTNPTSTMYLKITLYKVDVAAAETAISSQITTETQSNLTAPYFWCVQVPLTAETHFKKGESLRCEVIIYYALSTNSTTVTLYHSPNDANADASLETSRFMLFVPFVIQK